MATIFDTLSLNDDGSGSITRNTKKIVVSTSSYTVSDMKSGTKPICDKKEITGNSWTFTSEELPATIIYALAASIIEYLDKSITPTIPTGKENVIYVGDAVMASSFTFNIPTTDGVKKDYDIPLQNSWTGTLKAQLLQTGRVRIIGTITAPTTFNSLIANLPTELKPTASRKLVGFTTTGMATLEVDTVPTLKLPTSTTGVIEVDAEYEL